MLFLLALKWNLEDKAFSSVKTKTNRNFCRNIWRKEQPFIFCIFYERFCSNISNLIVSTTRRRRYIKIPCVCRSRAEKFNIVSNDHGRSHKCDISVSDRKYHFWAHLAQKIKIISLSWNLVPRLIQISRIQWWYSLVFVSDWNSPFWSNLVQKNKIVSFSWSLLSGLIRICRIQWWYSRFLL